MKNQRGQTPFFSAVFFHFRFPPLFFFPLVVFRRSVIPLFRISVAPLFSPTSPESRSSACSPDGLP
jgi:hypothetical protein